MEESATLSTFARAQIPTEQTNKDAATEFVPNANSSSARVLWVNIFDCHTKERLFLLRKEKPLIFFFGPKHLNYSLRMLELFPDTIFQTMKLP